jgi:hypothetical protein
MKEWTRRMLEEQNQFNSVVQSEFERMKKFCAYDGLDKYSSYGQLSAVWQVALKRERIATTFELNPHTDVLNSVERLRGCRQNQCTCSA